MYFLNGNLPLAWIAGIISGASWDLPLQKLQAGRYLIPLVYFIMSSLDASGAYVQPSYIWSIATNGSEKIMRATSLTLDASTESFELLYTDATNGWVIN